MVVVRVTHLGQVGSVFVVVVVVVVVDCGCDELGDGG